MVLFFPPNRLRTPYSVSFWTPEYLVKIRNNLLNAGLNGTESIDASPFISLPDSGDIKLLKHEVKIF